MKNTISISYDAEKLAALVMFLEQKSIDLNEEITRYIDTLYAKNVPINVRDFIEMKAGLPPTAKQSRKKKDNLYNE